MIQRLSKNIVNWQIKKNILTNEQRILYQYGYEILINQIVNILIAILIADMMHAPLTVFVFLVSYIPLRSYCGGSHARTHGGCTFVSALLILIVCFCEKAVNPAKAFVFSPISFAISGIVVFLLAPVADKNKPLDEAETIRYRKRSRYIWLMEAVLGMIFWYYKSRLGIIMALTHSVFSVMLVYGKLKSNVIK